METDYTLVLLDYDKKRLNSLFQYLLTSNGYTILEMTKNSKIPFNNIICEKENKKFRFVFNLSTIKEAYLPNNPTVKRRQIAALNIEDVPKNTCESLTILLGVAQVSNQLVFVAWNPFIFTSHKTNRSCYVALEDLLKMKDENLAKGKYGHAYFYLFKVNEFDKFIKMYIEENV